MREFFSEMVAVLVGILEQRSHCVIHGISQIITG